MTTLNERAQRSAAADVLAEIADHIREGRVAAVSLEWAEGGDLRATVVPLVPATFIALDFELETA